MINPVVSVNIVTYNHAKYISQAIEGALKQKTNFPVEILIGEDDSSDGTREICMEYAKNHPEKIRLFLNDRKNVIYINGSPTGRWNMINLIKNSRGKYIAFCDGDDYWINPYKLQKQVNILEKKQDYVICFHKAKIINEINHTEEIVPKKSHKIKSYKIKELISRNFMQTPTLMIRKLSIIYSKLLFNKNIITGDRLLTLLVAQFGKIYYLPEIMAIYRIHEGGIYSKKSKYYMLNNAEKLFETLKNYNEFKFPNLIKKKLEKIYISKIGYAIKNHNYPEIKSYLRKLKALKENSIKYFIAIMLAIIIHFRKILKYYKSTLK